VGRGGLRQACKLIVTLGRGQFLRMSLQILQRGGEVVKGFWRGERNES
jgi:hypothetical protein